MTELDKVRNLQEERWRIQDLERSLRESGITKSRRERILLRALKNIQKYRQIVDSNFNKMELVKKEVKEAEERLIVAKASMMHLDETIKRDINTLDHYINLKYEYQ